MTINTAWSLADREAFIKLFDVPGKKLLADEITAARMIRAGTRDQTPLLIRGMDILLAYRKAAVDQFSVAMGTSLPTLRLVEARLEGMVERTGSQDARDLLALIETILDNVEP